MVDLVAVAEPLRELPRPIEGCRFADPEDGTCSHPDTYSPECWVDEGFMSDCPVLTAAFG